MNKITKSLITQMVKSALDDAEDTIDLVEAAYDALLDNHEQVARLTAKSLDMACRVMENPKFISLTKSLIPVFVSMHARIEALGEKYSEEMETAIEAELAKQKKSEAEKPETPPASE